MGSRMRVRCQSLLPFLFGVSQQAYSRYVKGEYPRRMSSPDSSRFY